MAFVLYFFILLVSAAGVMFGLDLVTSPLPSTPNVPIGHSSERYASLPAEKRKIEPQAPKTAANQENDANVTDHSLTPIYPASPGPSAPMEMARTGPAEQDRPVTGQPQRETTASVAERETPASVAEPTKVAKVEPTVPAPRCNVEACSSAYRSFTAADCTYQPLQGPRRLCEKSEATTVASEPIPEAAPVKRAAPSSPAKQQTAARSKSRDELAEVERVVRRLNPASRPTRARALAAADAHEMSEVERIVRKMTRGRHAEAIPVIDGSGQVIIVHTDGPRAQAYRD